MCIRDRRHGICDVEAMRGSLWPRIQETLALSTSRDLIPACEIVAAAAEGEEDESSSADERRRRSHQRMRAIEMLLLEDQERRTAERKRREEEQVEETEEWKEKALYVSIYMLPDWYFYCASPCVINTRSLFLKV